MLNLFKRFRIFVLMSNVIEIVDSLQSKLSKLLSKYELLQTENQQLLEKSNSLVEELSQERASQNSLQQEYESLKIANAIVGSKEDKHTTKLKINALIREIDKCIAQLGE